jgi:type II secretory pathway pseudopilin PulG
MVFCAKLVKDMKNKKGFTLPDVVLIIIALAILAVAGMDFYVALLHRQQEVTRQMTAIDLATAQMEDLMAYPYGDPMLNAGNYPVTTIADEWTRTPKLTTESGFIKEDVTYRIYAPVPKTVSGKTFNLIPIVVTVLQPQIGGMARRQIVLTGFKSDQ